MKKLTSGILCFLLINIFSFRQLAGQSIKFPDIPGYHTMKCDFHMHTVFSDGSVWPDIRVSEALEEGLDAIAITDHIEYQPHKKDIKHPDRNRVYELASKRAKGTELLVINGLEITRSMPPGHANALFVKDANKFTEKNVKKVFIEAREQDAFVFWNHPHWTAQQKNGVATLSSLHLELIESGLIQGIEIYNDHIYSDEALQIALEHRLTPIGCSDVHGLVASNFNLAEGGHRPITLVFSEERSKEGLKKALFKGQTAVWFDNTLVGSEDFLSPLIRESISAEKKGSNVVQGVLLRNHSDADFILENQSEYNFHNKAAVFILKAHSSMGLKVKTLKKVENLDLKFKVLNAFSAPDKHVEITVNVK